MCNLYLNMNSRKNFIKCNNIGLLNYLPKCVSRPSVKITIASLEKADGSAISNIIKCEK